MWAPVKVLLLVCLLAVAVAGCNGDDDESGGLGSREADEQQIREKAVEHEAAFDSGNAERLCELLAPSSIENMGGMSACVKQYSAKNSILRTADDTDMRVVRVVIDEEDPNAATAYLRNKGFMYYLFEDGEWHPSLFIE